MIKLCRYGLLLFIVSSQIAQAQSNIDTLLVKELQLRFEADQFAANNAVPPASHSHLSLKEWKATKDSIYRSNQVRAEQILNKYGYPGYDVLGKNGTYLYFALVQHADHDPEFQKRALNMMRHEVEYQNASPQDFAFLTDRVELNTGGKQIYGTQVTYNLISGKASPRSTIDPDQINERRAKVGLEPIETYLADMTDSHMKNNSVTGGVTNVALLLLLGLSLAAIFLTIIVRKVRKRKSRRLFS
ncbi:DUF6624 domain-containing protein [Winogradskyella aurantiaca]|uniref:DUF6624 domain-containing protein n=1 Tax=Winogradskyella aurantiaca TaxID=2219558 RepID=UPI000E1E06FE|nr:DUF6624 domain-containing protein [Winogradskyella aurantiaca]